MTSEEEGLMEETFEYEEEEELGGNLDSDGAENNLSPYERAHPTKEHSLSSPRFSTVKCKNGIAYKKSVWDYDLDENGHTIPNANSPEGCFCHRIQRVTFKVSEYKPPLPPFLKFALKSTLRITLRSPPGVYPGVHPGPPLGGFPPL